MPFIHSFIHSLIHSYVMGISDEAPWLPATPLCTWFCFSLPPVPMISYLWTVWCGRSELCALVSVVQ